MAGGYLYGWVAATSTWVKVQCTAAGKLLADISSFLENPPTEDEDKKAPTSEWAFDHDADVAAHHARYTDAESRSAIGDKLNSVGTLLGDFNAAYGALNNCRRQRFTWSSSDGTYITCQTADDEANLYIYATDSPSTLVATSILVYNGSASIKLADVLEVAASILTHKNIAAAHHAKYTDLEAQTAVNLNGTLYWSCAGVQFSGCEPDVNDLTKNSDGTLTVNVAGWPINCPVVLPEGATITGAVAYGSAGTEDESWYLRRVDFSDGTYDDIASAAFNTEDTTITNAVVDNSGFGYYIITTNMGSTDIVYGARISFTL